MGQTCVRDPLSFIKLDLLQAIHAAQNLEAMVSDLRQTSVVVFDLQRLDVSRRDIRRFAAVHHRKALEFRAFAKVTKAIVKDVDGSKFTQRRERWQTR